MAKSILTPEGDLVNYDNLIAVSVEVRHSPDYDKVMSVQRDITRWLQSEAFSTFEMPTADEGGDA